MRRQCAYAYCFATEAEQETKFQAAGQEAPRPYVLRVPAGGGAVRETHFQLVLLGAAVPLLPYFVLAVNEWWELGIGPGHVMTGLQSAVAVHPFTGERHTIFEEGASRLTPPQWEVTVEQLLAAAPPPARELQVQFLTPTVLRFQGKPLAVPQFAPLVATLARRAEALCRHHALPAVVADAPALIRSSREVALRSWEGGTEQRRRYSSRQWRSMCVEGFVGTAVFEGELAPYLPLLKLGEYMHVGKGAVMGLGEMKVAGGAGAGS